MRRSRLTAACGKPHGSSANIATESLATTAELEIDGLDAASALARVLDATTVNLHPAATDLTLTLSTDGLRSATAGLTFATPAFGLTRHGARLDMGAARARLTASYAPGDTSLRVDDLKLGDILAAGTGTLKVKPGAGGVALEAALGRVDAGRVRAAALAVASDVALVAAVSSIVRSGTAVDLKLSATAERIGGLADVSVYDISMGVDGASIEIPVPVMTLTGASGKVRIAKGVLTASNVAGTIDGSSLRGGELVLALAPTVALSSLSVALDPTLRRATSACCGCCGIPRSHRRCAASNRLPAARRARSLSGGRARVLRQIYDVTSLNAKLRYAEFPLPVAIDSGGVHYETGGTLVLRKVSGTIGTSRIEDLDAEIAFAPGPVARSGSGAATLALDELYPWLITLPALEAFRGEIGALQGSVAVKLARLAGPLAAPGRLEVDAVLTPRTVRATSPRLPGSVTDRRRHRPIAESGSRSATASTSRCGTSAPRSRDRCAGLATPSPALDVSIARATIGPRGLEWVGNRGGRRAWRTPRWRRSGSSEPACVGPRPHRGGSKSLARRRSRAAPAPNSISATGPGSVEVRRLTLKDQDSDARATLDWQPERAGLSFHGLVSGRSMARILASPPAASGTLRGDFEATVDLTEALRSRANGKLEGAGVGLPDLFDLPLAIDRITLEADGERVRVRDTSLRLADQPMQLEGSIGRAGDGLLVDGTVTTEAIDAQRWLDRLRPGAADAGGASRDRWPVRGRIAVRAGHVDVLGYRVEPFAANVSLDGRKLAADVTTARRVRHRHAVHVDGVRGHARREGPRERTRPAGRRRDRVSLEGLAPRIGHDGRDRRFRGERNAGGFACLRARQRCGCAPATAASAA